MPTHQLNRVFAGYPLSRGSQPHPQGTPWGVYGILYYRLQECSGGKLYRTRACDSDVTSAYVERVAACLDANEGMVATCNSQPGGLVAWGSEEVRRAMGEAGMLP